MIAIAILIAASFLMGVFRDIQKDDIYHGRAITTAIGAISWWEISFPVAIIFLVIGSIWLIISLVIHFDSI